MLPSVDVALKICYDVKNSFIIWSNKYFFLYSASNKSDLQKNTRTSQFSFKDLKAKNFWQSFLAYRKDSQQINMFLIIRFQILFVKAWEWKRWAKGNIAFDTTVNNIDLLLPSVSKSEQVQIELLFSRIWLYL